MTLFGIGVTDLCYLLRSLSLSSPSWPLKLRLTPMPDIPDIPMADTTDTMVTILANVPPMPKLHPKLNHCMDMEATMDLTIPIFIHLILPISISLNHTGRYIRCNF